MTLRSFGIFFTILMLIEISLAIPRRRFYPAARDESSGAGEVPPKPSDENIEGRRRIPPFGDPDLLGNGVFDTYDTDLGDMPKDRGHGIGDDNPDYDFREPSDMDYVGPGKDFGYGRPTLDEVPVVPPKEGDKERDDGAEKKDEEGKVETSDAEEKDEADSEDEHKEGDQDINEEDTEDKKTDDSGAQDSNEDEVKTSEEEEETHTGDDEKNEGHDETDSDDDENADEGVKDEDEVETGIEDKEEHGGVLPFDDVFDSPFFNFRQVSHYFQQLEKALENAFRVAMEDAARLNTTYSNTTEEEIEVDGKKYKVHSSVLKAGNDNESFYLDVKYTEPVVNDTNVSDQN